jgi:hypothetical protein
MRHDADVSVRRMLSDLLDRSDYGRSGLTWSAKGRSERGGIPIGYCVPAVAESASVQGGPVKRRRV